MLINKKIYTSVLDVTWELFISFYYYMKAAQQLGTATVSTIDIKEEMTETAVRNWLRRAECFRKSWQVLSWSRIWSTEYHLMNRTVNKTFHKWTLTAGPSCLCAKWSCMHVPSPLKSVGSKNCATPKAPWLEMSTQSADSVRIGPDVCRSLILQFHTCLPLWQKWIT